MAAAQYVDCFLRLRDVRLNLLYFYNNFFFHFHGLFARKLPIAMY